MRWVLSLMLAMVALACDNPVNEGPPQPNAKSGYAIGKLADMRGGPLSNVTIEFNGDTPSGDHFEREVAINGPAGQYEIQLPEGTYNTPQGRISTIYQGKEFTLPLAPTDDMREWSWVRRSKSGIVRDFVWKIQGRKSSSMGNPIEPNGYWGATISLDKGGDVSDAGMIELRFKPKGPLIDGSEGKVLTFSKKLPFIKPDNYLFDLPIGRYTVTATMGDGMAAKKLRLAFYYPEEIGLSTHTDTEVEVNFMTHEPKKGIWELKVPILVVFPPESGREFVPFRR